MASSPQRPTDPDFDPPMIAWPPESEMAGFRKVVVNPFLAVMGLAGWGAAMRSEIVRETPPLAVASMALLALVPYLIHYHCLDCGRTGVLPRCKGHACPGVVARWRQARRARLGWPRPSTQMVVWAWVLGSAAVLLAVARLGMMG